MALDVLPGGVSPGFYAAIVLMCSICQFIHLFIYLFLGKASPELELSSQYQ